MRHKMEEISMKKVTSGLMLRYLIIVLVITGGFFTGCGSDSSDGSITADDVKGTWIKVWEGDPYAYSETGEADTLIFDIGDSDIQAVFYLETAQVGGFKGTYSITDDEIIVSVTETWNEDFDWIDGNVPKWNAEIDEYSFPFTTGSGSLSITGSDETVIEMDKISFSIQPELTGYWEKEEELMVMSPSRSPSRASAPAEYIIYLSFNGEYEREWDFDYYSGSWEASDYGNGFLRTIITDYTDSVDSFSDLDYGFLYHCSLEDESTLVIDSTAYHPYTPVAD